MVGQCSVEPESLVDHANVESKLLPRREICPVFEPGPRMSLLPRMARPNKHEGTTIVHLHFHQWVITGWAVTRKKPAQRVQYHTEGPVIVLQRAHSSLNFWMNYPNHTARNNIKCPPPSPAAPPSPTATGKLGHVTPDSPDKLPRRCCRARYALLRIQDGTPCLASWALFAE